MLSKEPKVHRNSNNNRSKNNLNIRNANKDDIWSIYELMCELEDIKFDKNSFEHVFNINMQNKDIFYFVAEMTVLSDNNNFSNVDTNSNANSNSIVADDAIVGFGSLFIQTPLHHVSRIGEIQELVIKNGMQGNGIGKKLLSQLENTAISEGCSQVELSSNQRRIHAHRFYEREGFMKTHFKFSKL